MKKYIIPSLEIVKLQSADIIATSFTIDMESDFIDGGDLGARGDLEFEQF